MTSQGRYEKLKLDQYPERTQMQKCSTNSEQTKSIMTKLYSLQDSQGWHFQKASSVIYNKLREYIGTSSRFMKNNLNFTQFNIIFINSEQIRNGKEHSQHE